MSRRSSKAAIGAIRSTRRPRFSDGRTMKRLQYVGVIALAGLFVMARSAPAHVSGGNQNALTFLTTGAEPPSGPNGSLSQATFTLSQPLSDAGANTDITLDFCCPTPA